MVLSKFLLAHSLAHAPYLKVSAGLTDSTEQQGCKREKKSTVITGHFGLARTLHSTRYHDEAMIGDWLSDFLVKTAGSTNLTHFYVISSASLLGISINESK